MTTTTKNAPGKNTPGEGLATDAVNASREGGGGSLYRVYRVANDVTVTTNEEHATAGPESTDAFSGDGVLIPVGDPVRANGKENACWKIVEGQLKDEAQSDNPPVLTAVAVGRGGMSEPAPYALETTTKRKKG